jgi:hypothetical protein
MTAASSGASRRKIDENAQVHNAGGGICRGDQHGSGTIRQRGTYKGFRRESRSSVYLGGGV